MEKYTVTLSEKEWRRLFAIVTKGRKQASFIQRAYILLKSADGKTDAKISQWLYQQIYRSPHPIAILRSWCGCSAER